MASVNGSFVSPSADAVVSPRLFEPTGLVASVLEGFTVWKALLTLFVAAVIYDQCTSSLQANARESGQIATQF